jgi:hypothetical protein
VNSRSPLLSKVPIAVAVEFGDGDRLHNVEAVPGAVVEELFRLLAVQAVKEFPGGVAEPEERLAILGDEETVVVRDFEFRQGRGSD